MTTTADSTPSNGERRLRFSWLHMAGIGCVGIAVLIAILWNSSAARREVRIPLTGDLSSRPEPEIVASLKEHGVDQVTIVDGCVVVLATDESRCRQFLQELADRHGTWADEWQRANEQLTPFSSASERSAAREIARARRISQMLSEMPGVQHADIVWDEQPGRGFRQEATVRATVYIRPESDSQLTPQVVASIREAVAGSKANLDPANVVVMDLSTGMTHHADEVAELAVAIVEALPDPIIESTEPTAPAEAATPIVVIDPPSPAVAGRDVPAPSNALAQPIEMMERSDVDAALSTTPSPPVTTTLLDPIAVAPVPSLIEPVGIARLDNTSSMEAIEPKATQPIVPRRNREVNASNRPSLARGDLRFLAWVGIGLVVLIAALQSLLSRPRDEALPDLSLSYREPTSVDGNAASSTTTADVRPQHVTHANRVASAGDSSNSLHSVTEPPGRASHDASLAFSEESNNPLAGFDHLGWLDAEAIQKLYRCLPDEPWALALSGASTQIQDHVLKCLPRTSSMLLQRRMDSLPAIRLRDVEEAQRRLAEWIRKLDETAESRS